jgi:hypothetical protein
MPVHRHPSQIGWLPCFPTRAVPTVTNFHEDLNRMAGIRASSNRNFGLVFAAVFLLIALRPLWSGGAIRIWVLAVAVSFLALALIRPVVLQPVNRIWFRIGLLLGRIVNPIVMSVLFFVVMIPTGLLLRMMGKDLLRLEKHAVASTYWIPKDPPGPSPETMIKQF